MCQSLPESNVPMEPTTNELLGPSNEDHGGSSTLHVASSEEGSVKQDGSITHEAPMSRSATSLTSFNSFASNYSDYSVDFNPGERNNPEEGASKSGQDDPKYTLPNGHLSSSSSSADPDEHDAIANSMISDGYSDEENEPSSTLDDRDELWDPPEAENDEINKANSMATLVDEDDECADGDREWAESSSLVSSSYRFNEEKQKALEEVMNGKFKSLVSQLLKKIGVDNEIWVDIVKQLAWQAASFVKPDSTDGKAKDPTGQVKIKCIASGSRSESQLIKGMVFKKHAAHKHMPTTHKSPKLLLIEGVLDQSSNSSGLASFNAMITPSQAGQPPAPQDTDNITDLIENLRACGANVILVEKSAPRNVLEEVLKLKVTLVLDMKPGRLKKVAECTGSPILSSNITFNQGLKHCDSLYFEKIVEEHAIVGEGGKKPCKTLMFVEGCPTRLRCTILLKGSHSEELKKIKCVVQCAVVMAYHFIMETNFLVNQKAMFSTIAFGRATDVALTDEQSTSDVSETSNSHCSCNAKPNTDGASIDEVQVPVSTCSDEGSSQVQESASTSTSSGVLDIPISNGLHVEESTHVKETSAEAAEIATSNGFHDKVPDNTLLEVDRTCTAHYEPRIATLSAASPSITAALEEVSVVSPATYEQMSTYIGLNGGEHETQTAASIPISPVGAASDQYDIKATGSSKEDKALRCNSLSLSMLDTTSGDERKMVDDGEECIQPKNEISSVLDSESILVLMSTRNASRGTICEQSHFTQIKFYQNLDVHLGKFLRDNLFNQSLPCKACGGLPEAHFYYYAHHNKQLTIRIKRLGDKKHLPGESEEKLWMWSRCGKCEPDKEKATKRVLISTAARSLSFGKFLELSLSSHSSFNRLSSCGHSFQKDFLYFFGLGSMVAMFRHSRVATYTVSVPAQKLEFNSSINRDWLQQEIESVYVKGFLLFTEVAECLKNLESQFSGLNLVLNGSSKVFADIVDMLKSERSEFEVNISNIGTKDETSHNSLHKLLSLNRLRAEILLEACVWRLRLQLLLSSSSTLVGPTSSKGMVQKQMDFKEDSGVGEAEGSQTAAEKGVQGQLVLENPRSGGEVEGTQEAADGAVEGQLEEDQSEKIASAESQTGLEDHSGEEVEGVEHAVDSGHCDALSEGKETSEDCNVVEVQIEPITGADKRSVEELSCEGMHQGGEQDPMSLSVTEENVQRLASEDSVPSISLLQESETNPASGIDIHQSDSISNLLEDSSVAVTLDQESDSCAADKDLSKGLASPPSSNSVDLEGTVWYSFAQIREEYMKDLHNGSLPKLKHLPKSELLHNPDFLPRVSQTINDEGSRLHIPLSNGDYMLSDYDGEISSSVACALAVMKDLSPPASDDENPTLKRAASEPGWPSVPNDRDVINSAPSMPRDYSFSSCDDSKHFDCLVTSGQVHHEINLGIGKYPIKGKYSVVIMYASEFRGFRNRCCPSELDYIASLSRCKLWDAKGGKSKSFFAKTLDDRLIIKEIKKTELESFVKFAPDYFRHMKESFDSGNQTCLAKILGIYQVTIRHAKSGKETKHDLMVQENLSFGRNITRQYDLKGALHARFTATADGTGDVLLDQNFVNDMNSSPLYIVQKSKRVLQRAVWNDTSFLNAINVMDYSLLVGVDRQRRDLVCGIIDYLRQYTWDKQFETWVKTSLVVPKNVLPTIISPKEYKKRFRKFMDTHFLTVPDHWCSQRSSNPCKLCGIKGYDSSVAKSEKRDEELNDISCT